MREIIPFLVQTLVMPLCLLLVFGRIMPGVGATHQTYPASLLPGVIAFSIFQGCILAITLSLILDLGAIREIDDRLLVPLPVSLVAIEKVFFSAIRAMFAGALTFLLAYWILGSGYQVRGDELMPLISIMFLYALSSSALGYVMP